MCGAPPDVVSTQSIHPAVRWHIARGTVKIVSPLRPPLQVVKAITAVDRWSGGLLYGDLLTRLSQRVP